jgi:hypothetical protein
MIKSKIVNSENPLEHWCDIYDLQDKIVLDLGCGWINEGHMSTPEYFLSRGSKKIIGIDSTKNEIDRLIELYPSHIFIHKVINSTQDLSELISEHKPDLIKMDIEGSEIYLKDIPKQVFYSVKEFAIEYHNPECKKVIINKFEELGFKVTAINSFGYYCTDSNKMGIIHSRIK